MKNEYLPNSAKIKSIQKESFDIKTFKVSFEDKVLGKSFSFKAGQFMQVSLLGVGEAPISITSHPDQRDYLEFTIRAMGGLTSAICELKKKDTIYLRGPYGNSFPVDEVNHRDLYFIAGGIGLPPLRSVINSVFGKRKDFGRIKILYGVKTPDELCFKQELKNWSKMPDTQVLLTADTPDKNWKHNVGVVTTLWDKTDMNTTSGIAYVCGPPIMLKFVIEKLMKNGFQEENIYLTLERYMKCGIGKCGHCNIAEKFVCIDGPVFSYSQLRKFPEREKAIA